ncbi:hypothetical protein Golomagni_07721 [Golovinomyces magnicellulatus]|nr:hypothetical protein Golomagni_07721 [Golovinomyces magnicellulatus]
MHLFRTTHLVHLRLFYAFGPLRQIHQQLTIHRQAFFERPEEGVCRLRLPQRQDSQVYVSSYAKQSAMSSSTGARRPSAERPPAPAACATSRMFHGDSRTVSRSASPRAPVEPSSRSKATVSFVSSL